MQDLDIIDDNLLNFEDDDEPSSSTENPTTTLNSSIAHLVALYGSSSATAWLEFSRYKIWQASPGQIHESTFAPIQGYMQHKKHIYAWGDPLVSSPTALLPTAKAFVDFATKQGCKVIWCCADQALQQVLSNDLKWAAVECIHEEVVDPTHVIELTNARGMEGVGAVKDLKKNLRRAERAGVQIEETTGNWNDKDRKEVEDGLTEWRKSKGLKGVQLASTTGQPWIDEPHRRYWVAKQQGHIVGILILTPIHGPHRSSSSSSAPSPAPSQSKHNKLSNLFTHHSRSKSPASSDSSSPESSPMHSPTFTLNHSAHSSASSLALSSPEPEPSYYLIKNAISFPSAPRGTSETLIYTALDSLYTSHSKARVTFGISASDELVPIAHLSGWKISSLSKVYGQVAKGAGLLKRADFRAKFDSGREGMYVCYPELGLDGLKGLLKVLKK